MWATAKMIALTITGQIAGDGCRSAMVAISVGEDSSAVTAAA